MPTVLYSGVGVFCFHPRFHHNSVRRNLELTQNFVAPCYMTQIDTLPVHWTLIKLIITLLKHNPGHWHVPHSEFSTSIPYIARCGLVRSIGLNVGKAYRTVPNKTLCTLTDTLVNSGGPQQDYRGFSAIFDQFSPILQAIFHQKVQGHIYSIRSMYSALDGIHWQQ